MIRLAGHESKLPVGGRRFFVRRRRYCFPDPTVKFEVIMGTQSGQQGRHSNINISPLSLMSFIGF